jgi:hypothetical protein
VRAATRTRSGAPRWTTDCDLADADKVLARVRDGIVDPGLAALGQRFGRED